MSNPLREPVRHLMSMLDSWLAVGGLTFAVVVSLASFVSIVVSIIAILQRIDRLSNNPEYIDKGMKEISEPGLETMDQWGLLLIFSALIFYISGGALIIHSTIKYGFDQIGLGSVLGGFGRRRRRI